MRILKIKKNTYKPSSEVSSLLLVAGQYFLNVTLLRNIRKLV